MNCNNALYASSLLKSIIENTIDEMSIEDVFLSDEMRLLVHFHEEIKKEQLCMKCEGCLDFAYLNKIFNEFYEELDSLCKENINILKHILDHLNIIPDTESEIINLFIYICKNYKKYINIYEIDSNKIDAINQKIFNTYKKLTENYLYNKIADCNDRIFDNMHLLDERKIVVENCIINNEKTIYLDQNIISYCLSHESLKKQLESFTMLGRYKIVISSYIIEDAIKMNKLYFKEYIEYLEKIAKDHIILHVDDNLNIKKEKLKITVDRVSLFREMTKAAEEKKIYELKFNNLLFPKFSKKSKNYNLINDDLNKFILDVYNNRSPLLTELDKIIAINNLNLSIDDIINRKYTNLNDMDTISKINDLSIFLDVLNYSSEKSTTNKKIMSSLQDTEHIKHAWICDYFVSNDDKLLKRMKYIYDILNIKIELLNYKEFKKMMTEELKSFRNRVARGF